MTSRDETGAVADAAADNWVDLYAPTAAKPYLRMMRADRPIGAWLLMTPGWQAIVLAGGAAEWSARSGELATFGWLATLWLFIAFAVGAVVMRGAGCVFNDIVDRDIDARVARTRSRPLPSGQVTLTQAAGLLAGLCILGLLILLTFNNFAIWLGLAAALPVVVYPFMKRVTWWPQAFLGVAFNWGALLGWAAMTGGVGWAAAALYLGGVAWTIGYDTIYAHQDREDDALIGVKSTARLFQDRSREAVAAFYVLAVTFAALAGVFAGLGFWFWIGLIAYAAHLFGQAYRLDIDDEALCLHLFRSNREAGLILFGALILGSL